MSTHTAALVLYRNLLREARKVNDYNFRMYAMRRVKQGFVKNRNLQGYVVVESNLFDSVML